MNRELIDSKTQKTIVQHDWLKGHEFRSPYGSVYQIMGLLGGGFSESYLAAFKLDANGQAIRDPYTARPRIERLAITPVIIQLNERGIYAPWDPRAKNLAAEPDLEAEAEVEQLVDLGEDEEDSELDAEEAVAEAHIPETSNQPTRAEREARLLARINRKLGKQPVGVDDEGSTPSFLT